MLLSAAAGIFVYQQFFIDKPASALKLETNQSSVDTNNIDLSKLIAKEFNGTNVDLTEYRGKHLVINFWATWCAPCRKEIPLFIELQEKYKHQNVQVIGIAMDDAAKAEQYMESIGFNYPSLISDLTQTTRFGQALNYEFIAVAKIGKLVAFFSEYAAIAAKIEYGEVAAFEWSKPKSSWCA